MKVKIYIYIYFLIFIAVILNEHLVKTLKLLRKDNSEESIDKYVFNFIILAYYF